jgi:hypothetical protein
MSSKDISYAVTPIFNIFVVLRYSSTPADLQPIISGSAMNARHMARAILPQRSSGRRHCRVGSKSKQPGVGRRGVLLFSRCYGPGLLRVAQRGAFSDPSVNFFFDISDFRALAMAKLYRFREFSDIAQGFVQKIGIFCVREMINVQEAARHR